MIIEEKTLSRNEIYKGRVLTYVVDTVDVNNTTRTREMVFHPGGVGIVAIDDDNLVYLVKQFRKPYDKAILEIPAGKLEKGEDPKESALRELLEETGYKADKITSLGEFYPSVGYTNEIIHLYLATHLTKDKQNLDDDEYVDVEKISLDDLVDMIMSNEVKDGKTIAGILKAKEYLNKKIGE